MGLGKTVMTIALILARLGKGKPENNDSNEDDPNTTEYLSLRRKNSKIPSRPRGGTLIICPMALLSQWKVSFL
jgi:DNA repair protein RAD5